MRLLGLHCIICCRRECVTARPALCAHRREPAAQFSQYAPLMPMLVCVCAAHTYACSRMCRSCADACVRHVPLMPTLVCIMYRPYRRLCAYVPLIPPISHTLYRAPLSSPASHIHVRIPPPPYHHINAFLLMPACRSHPLPLPARAAPPHLHCPHLPPARAADRACNRYPQHFAR